MNNFHYAISLAQTLYDIEADDEDLEEVGLVAYNFIGNKNTRLYRAQLECHDGVIELPCNVDIIEAVTYCGPEDWNYTSNKHYQGDRNSSYVEDYIESHKAALDPIYVSGKYVKYKKVGNQLFVNKGLGRVNILYHGILLDDEGLPAINDKEAIAIADYIAFVFKQKEAWKTHNLNIMAEAKEAQKQWAVHCDAARVPEYISQDEMDKILNVQSSWGRKVYNKSFKPTL